jgi:uncharacterized membrane protein
MLSVFAAGALVAAAMRQEKWAAAGLAAGSGMLLWRGFTGHCTVYSAAGINSADEDYKSQRTERVITINKSPSELYAFWRNFENLPRIMGNLESVHVVDESTSVWRAKAPVHGMVEWEAEITDDVEDRRIAWRSRGDASVPNSGMVEFRPAPAGRGAIVRVTMEYQPPGGALGLGLAKLLGSSPGQEIEEDLRRFKAVMEAGEMPTTEGQPSAHRHSMFAMFDRSAT